MPVVSGCWLSVAGVIVVNNYQCFVRLNKPSMISTAVQHIKVTLGKDCDQRRNAKQKTFTRAREDTGES